VIFKYCSYKIIRETGRISRIVLVHYKIKAIVSIEPIVGTKPHESFIILENTYNRRGGKAIIKCEMFELQALRLSKNVGYGYQE
jgi:hypothetical protein